MAKTLIIGFGNPLRSDDGAGWRAACLLEKRVHRPDVTVLVRHQLTPELAEDLSHAERVIFIDASATQPPGTFARREIHPAPSIPEAFSHDCAPPTLLALAHALYGSCPQASVVEIGAADFGYGGRLSPVVETSVKQAVELILSVVEE